MNENRNERGVTVVLERIADLGEKTGVHLIITGAGVEGDNDLLVTLAESGPRRIESGPHRLVDGWYEADVPSDGPLHLEVLVTTHCEPHPTNGDRHFQGCGSVGRFDPNNPPERTFTIDLTAAGVPARLWQKGAAR